MQKFKRDINVFIDDADCQMVFDMLSQKRYMLPDFSLEYFAADGGRLGGLFWADKDTKGNYFACDVMVFDATYRTNK